MELRRLNSHKWYAINTNPRCEDLVYRTLTNASFEVFLPKINTKKHLKEVKEPLFPGYLFVRLNTELSNWVKIKYTPGVRKILSYGDTPTPVPEEIIITISEKIKGYAYSHKVLPFIKGDRVKFTKGPFEGLEGMFTGEVSGKDRVRILLEAIYWSSTVEIEATELTKVS